MIGIAVSEFNEEITGRLLASCLRALKEGGAEAEVVRVPGAYELPWTAQELALSKRFDAVVCLGAVIQGQTKHDFYIADAVSKALQEISVRTRVPCLFGVLTPKNEKQALARTRGSLDRGREVGLAALRMAELRRRSAAGKLGD